MPIKVVTNSPLTVDEAFIHLVKFSQQYNPLFVEYCASIRLVRKVNRLVSMN